MVAPATLLHLLSRPVGISPRADPCLRVGAGERRVPMPLRRHEVEADVVGCLQVPDSFAARVLSPIWEDGELGAIGETIDLACRYGPHPFHQATGAFSRTAGG
jgi:hypothetical protein